MIANSALPAPSPAGIRCVIRFTRLPVAPNLDEQRKMLPLLEGFAKAMLLCASGDGELATELSGLKRLSVAQARRGL